MYNNDLNKIMKERKKKTSKSVPGGLALSTTDQYSSPNSNYFINRMQTVTPYPQGNDTMRIVNQQINGVPSRMIYNSNFGNPRVQIDQNGQSNLYTDPNMVNMYRNQIAGYYKKGGGMFPPYDSWAPPRMDYGGDPSIPDLEEGDWLKKYDIGGQTTGSCPTGFTKNAFGVCVNASGQTPDQAAGSKAIISNIAKKTTSSTPAANTTVSSDATRVNRMDFNKTPQGKHHEAVINTMKTSPGLSYQQASDRVDMTNSSLANTSSLRELTPQEKQKWESENKAEKWRSKYVPLVSTEGEKIERMKERDQENDEAVAATNSAILAKDKGQPFTFPTGKTKTWDQMDWREKGYVTGLAQSRDLKLFPNATSNNYIKTTIDDWNPFPVLNTWVKGFAEAPYMARETDSYMPYVGAVLDPAITVAAVMAGQPELTAGEALTANILNPKKPFQTMGKFMAAAEEGQLGSFMAQKMKKDFFKDSGKSFNQQLKTDIGNPVVKQQTNQLLNTKMNEGINKAGFINNPFGLISGISKALTPTLSSIQKFGGSTTKTKNWTNKYK